MTVIAKVRKNSKKKRTNIYTVFVIIPFSSGTVHNVEVVSAIVK